MRPEEFDSMSRNLASPTNRRMLLALLGVGAAAGAVAVIDRDTEAAKNKDRRKARKRKNRQKRRNRRGNGGDNPFRSIAVTGTDAGGAGVFAGTLDVAEFVAEGDEIVAVGQLTGTLDANGTPSPVSEEVRLPVLLAASGSDTGGTGVGAQGVACGILDLTLGPLDLNLLGLQVNLSQIDLEITAIPGGGLLGDLLCAIANLLNPLGAILQIVEALNDLLDFFS